MISRTAGCEDWSFISGSWSCSRLDGIGTLSLLGSQERTSSTDRSHVEAAWERDRNHRGHKDCTESTEKSRCLSSNFVSSLTTHIRFLLRTQEILAPVPEPVPEPGF